MRSGSWAPALLLVLLLATPSSTAGSEASPEVDDEPDGVPSHVDLLSMWFTNERDGVRITWKVADLRTTHADTLYFSSFRAAGQRHIVAAGYDENGTLLGHTGPFNGPSRARGLETFANLETITVRKSSPGYVTAFIPHEKIPGLKPGSVIIDIVGGTDTYDRNRRTWAGGTDVQGSTATFRVESPPAFDTRIWGIASAVATVTLGIAAITLLVARRLRPATMPEKRNGHGHRHAPAATTGRFRLTPPHPPGEDEP